MRPRCFQRRRRHPLGLVLAGLFRAEVGGCLRRLRGIQPRRHHRVRGVPAHRVQPDPRHRDDGQRRSRRRDASCLRWCAAGHSGRSAGADRRRRGRPRPVRTERAAGGTGGRRRCDLRRAFCLPDDAHVLQQDDLRRAGSRRADDMGRVHRVTGRPSRRRHHTDGARCPRRLGAPDVRRHRRFRPLRRNPVRGEGAQRGDRLHG